MSMDLDLDHEPLPEGVTRILEAGSKAPDFEFILTSEQRLSLLSLLKRTHVLLNFIKGTWCPFCQQHMSQLRNWQKKLEGSYNTTILVLSNEPSEILRAWAKDNKVIYLLGSVQNSAEVFKKYGVSVGAEPFARPAVFLIDPLSNIRMAFDGTRGKELQAQCLKCGVL